MYVLVLGAVLVLVVVLCIWYSSKEKFGEFWPYQDQSFPYHYAHGGVWPEGMYSRLRFNAPGFYNGTGFSKGLREGVFYPEWPRNRWVRHNGERYFINNKANGTQHNFTEVNRPIGSIKQPYRTVLISD